MTIKLSEDARNDLASIWRYIAQDNPVAASKTEEEIMRACDILAKHPLIGHKREELTNKPLRFYSVYHYMIIYKPDTSPLEIIRILSGFRDIANIL